jgi:hypothetical protein
MFVDELKNLNDEVNFHICAGKFSKIFSFPIYRIIRVLIKNMNLDYRDKTNKRR